LCLHTFGTIYLYTISNQIMHSLVVGTTSFNSVLLSAMHVE